MSTVELTHAVGWLSERLPGAQLADLAALLELGLAAQPVPMSLLVAKLGLHREWAEGFVTRQVQSHGGLEPLVELNVDRMGNSAQLSQVGHNILNQFWQRSGAGDAPDTTSGAVEGAAVRQSAS
jgi:hypothetical protein